MLTRMLMAQMSWTCSHDVETHGHAVTQNIAEHLFTTVLLNRLVHVYPVTIPVHRRLWNMEEGRVLSLECRVWSMKYGVSNVKCQV